MSRAVQITVDARDPRALSTFWREALGYVVGARRLRRQDPVPPLESGFVVLADPEGNEFCLG